jgi:hypothetical protein
MTGLECLRAELRKRGFTNAQIEGKAASAIAVAVLDIVANTDHVFSDMVKAERELEDIRHKAELCRKSEDRRWDDLREAEQDFKQARWEMVQYIEKFNAALSECETAEGRDAMRRAQMFVNSVSVNSKYDNTAYIIGLASILTNGSIGAIDELKKMNPKLFRDDELHIEL